MTLSLTIEMLNKFILKLEMEIFDSFWKKKSILNFYN